MTSQTDRKELQNTSCQISQRSKISQTRKFGQLIEYNMRLFFFEKSYCKYDEETSPRLIFKN